MLEDTFDQLDESIQELEQNAQSADLAQLLPIGATIVKNTLLAFASAHKKNMPQSDDLLELLKAFVKGDPSLNAVRDNVREIVYYQNCLAENRFDVLPAKPEKMLAHTVRHIYFYLRSRCEQENLFDE